ncbi:MAG: hypothetical protein Q9174_003854 [Haloplaca sp. 1 TL-2023]
MASQASAPQPPSQRPSSSRAPSTASLQPGQTSPSHSTRSEDSQTVFLNTPTSTSEASSLATNDTTKNARIPHAKPDPDVKKCWICFSDETEDGPLSSDWRSPCPCALKAHESCLLDWIADKEKPQQNESRQPQKIECPQCKGEIQIARPRSRIVDSYQTVEEKVRRLFWPAIATSLITSLGAGCVLHGASSLYLLLGRRDAQIVMGVNYGRMPSADTMFALATIPITLMAANTKIADAILPVIPLLLYTSRRPSLRRSRYWWPPSVTMTLACLPHVHLVYKGLMKRLFHEREKKWIRQVQPRLGEDQDNANDRAGVQPPADNQAGEGFDFELGVELEIIDEEEVEVDAEGREEGADVAVVNDAGEAVGEQGQDQDQDQDGAHDAGQQQQQQQQEPPNPEQNPNQVGNNNAGANQQPAPAAAEQHRVIRLVPLVSAVVHSMMGALAFPAVASGMGDLISFVLPRTWSTPPGAWERRSHGFLQSRFGRSVLGGCLFLVLKDTLSLYSKYRLAQDHMHRRVLDFDRKNGRARAGS